MITLNDGSVWLPVFDRAKEIWNSGIFSLYDVNKAEGTVKLIETDEHLLRSYENDTACISFGDSALLSFL